jgi:hypothetical protein
MKEELLKMIPMAVPVFALIFQAGKQSEKIDDLFSRMDKQVEEQKSTREILYDIDHKITVIEQDVKHLLIAKEKT